MKKTLFALIGLNLTVAFGQVVSNDFENITLATESFDHGSSGSGGFSEDHSFYENIYDSNWDYWTGFSISNISDNTTSGIGNQFSAFPGSGAGNSTNYGVYYLMGGIDLTTESNGVHLDSVKITNTTYSAISMRDGDAYGKQFGSIYDANGVEDGTNGEDYFRIWIMAEYVGGQLDSLDFYLADYRFADPNDDYIIDEWVNVDLSAFDQPVARLDFRFESSDIGQWGINTPTYFAIDDLSFTAVSGFSESELKVDVYPNPVIDILNVSAEEIRGKLSVIELTGKSLKKVDFTGYAKLDLSELESGVYILEIISEDGKLLRSTFLK